MQLGLAQSVTEPVQPSCESKPTRREPIDLIAFQECRGLAADMVVELAMGAFSPGALPKETKTVCWTMPAS